MIEEAGYSPSTPWRERSLRTKLACVVGAAWTIYIALNLFKVFFYAGVVIYPLAHRAICAGALIVLTLLALPARKKGKLGMVPWYDGILILWTIAACAYVAVYAPVFVFKWGDATPIQMFLAIGMSLAMLEAIRRSTGWALVALILAGFFYLVYCDYFPGFLMGAGYSYPRAIGWIFLSGEGYWGAILGVVAVTVPGFIMFGVLLQTTGASDFLTKLAFAALGGTRGGPAKVCVLASTFIGTFTGSVAANVATTGQITIPLMKKSGLSAEQAGAVEATSSTGAMFTPPIMGATAFLIADFLGVSYWAVCVAAFLPAVLYYLVILFQVDLEAVRLGMRGLPKSELPKAGEALRQGWFYLPPFVVLVVYLGVFNYSAETTIMYTLVAMIVCASISPRGRLNLKKILWVLESTAQGMISIIPVCTGIGVIVAAFTITGAGVNLSAELADLAVGNYLLMLLFAALASFVLGLGMTAVSCYLLGVTLLAPGMIMAGVDPMAAHMFLFIYGCLSFITPPVAIAAFVACGISGGSPTSTGIHAMRLGIAAFFLPWTFALEPALLWQGTYLAIFLALAAALLSLISLSVGLVRFFRAPLRPWQSIVSVALGVAVFVPHLLPYREYITAVVILWLLFLLWSSRRMRHSGSGLSQAGQAAA